MVLSCHLVEERFYSIVMPLYSIYISNRSVFFSITHSSWSLFLAFSTHFYR